MKLPKFRPGDYVRQKPPSWARFAGLTDELGPIGKVKSVNKNWVLIMYPGSTFGKQVDKRQCIKLSEMDVMIYMLEQ